MKNKKLVVIFVGILLFSIAFALIPLKSYCQDEGPPRPPTPTPSSASSPTPTPTTTPTSTPEETPEETFEPSGTTTPKVTLIPTPKGGAAGLNYTLVGGAIVAAIAVLGVLLVFMKKRRVSERSLRRYSSQQFQNWVLKKLDGKISSSRDVSMGIDGFTGRGYPILIKQTDSVGMMEVDRFASTLAKNRTRNGVIVAFSFGGDAVRGKVRAKTSYGLDIEMLTVNDLIYIRRPY